MPRQSTDVQNVYDGIMSDVINGRLNPGDRLLPCKKIAVMLNITCKPTSTALSRLTTLGLLETRNNATFVANAQNVNCALLKYDEVMKPINEVKPPYDNGVSPFFDPTDKVHDEQAKAILEQVVSDLQQGRLRPGDKVMTVNVLKKVFNVRQCVISRVYGYLIDANVISSGFNRGHFVNDQSEWKLPELTKDERVK